MVDGNCRVNPGSAEGSFQLLNGERNPNFPVRLEFGRGKIINALLGALRRCRSGAQRKSSSALRFYG